ncbi:DUF1254 domain-containing protein [Aquisphaera insulae]|uniref:DUF1254 domain-containing protein n=1 Tax=Aquisphaera insulae TaxID=2712864 RepID=UPI00196AC49C|nr:DUF1254 domain-containing protein [Aquisphaera insulae]
MNTQTTKLAVLGIGLIAIASASTVARAQVDEARSSEIGIEAYVYGYPLVTMEFTRRVMTNVAVAADHHAPMGQFYLSRTYPDAKFRDVTAPNADTLYSTAWLDLGKEPYVLSLPDMGDRYFLMPMLSGWTDVFEVPGTRTTGNKAQAYAITGPGWKGELPEGVKELKAPTDLVWILGRTYCTGTPADYEACHAVMNKYDLRPLSAYGKPYTPPAGSVDPAVDMKTAVREQVHKLDAGAYFKLLATLLKANPPAREDAPIVEKLATLGIVPGKDFDVSSLDPAVARGLAQVPRAGQARIMSQFQKSGTLENGWMFATRTGIYGTDYLQRALITAIGLGANRPQDAVYPTSTTDSAGKKYSGANTYTVHFPKGQTPPVHAFWSITMYDADYFFVDNPLNRYTVSPRNELKYNQDGSLDLIIQNESPGADREANWLPAPKGEFVLMMRLYWPRVESPSIIDGSWKLPAVKLEEK